MKLWYVYNQAGAHVNSFGTKQEAIDWAENQIEQWRQAGAPRLPWFKVHYNGAVQNEPQIVGGAK